MPKQLYIYTKKSDSQTKILTRVNNYYTILMKEMIHIAQNKHGTRRKSDIKFWNHLNLIEKSILLYY